jgi:hypothetical protein
VVELPRGGEVGRQQHRMDRMVSKHGGPPRRRPAPGSLHGARHTAARRTCGGYIPPADAGQATAFCSSGHPQAAALSAVDGAVRTHRRGPAAPPDTAAAVQTAQPDLPPLLFRTGGWGRYAGRAPIMLASLEGGRDLRQQRSRAPRPAAPRTSRHVHGGYCAGHHVSALAAGIR